MRRKEGIDTTRDAREGCGESEGSEGFEGLGLPWSHILITYNTNLGRVGR